MIKKLGAEFLGCVIGRRGITIPLPPSGLAKNIVLNTIDDTTQAIFFGCHDANPNVAKAGGIQSQGAKGAAVVLYCNPLATPDLESSGFSVEVKT